MMLPLLPSIPASATSASFTAPSASSTTTKSPKGTSSMTQLGETGRENTGRWTCEEHVLFLKGLEMHGKGWKKIAKLIKTRTVVQIRTHAQKYFQKLAKAKKNGHHGDMLGMEGSHFGGKRVKFTGKRRGLVYNSYLVGAEATSAAISPALQTFMPANLGIEGERVGLMTDKEEDAAIEKGLYRFLSPVVLDPATRNLDASAPEILPLPPSTPAMGVHHTSSRGSSRGGLDGETTGEEDGGSDSIVMGDGGSDQDAESSLGEPLPTLARVTPEMYTRCGVPEWFKKGGDIDELLIDAAGLDWRSDSGGDARKVVDQGTSILNANINGSNCATVAPAVVRKGCGSNTNKMNSAAPVLNMTGLAGAGGLSGWKGKGSDTSEGSSSNGSSKNMALTANASAGCGQGSWGVRGGAQKKQQQQQHEVPTQQQQVPTQQQQVHGIHVKEEGMELLRVMADRGTVHGHVHEEDGFAAFDPHHVELKEEHSHHDLLLEELPHDSNHDDALAHIVFSVNGESDLHSLPRGAGGGGAHVHAPPVVVGGRQHHYHHNDNDIHLHAYDAYLEEEGADGGHGLLLLEDLDGGIEF
ncbi:sant myb domain protein [Nannochloropsis oceanica]